MQPRKRAFRYAPREYGREDRDLFEYLHDVPEPLHAKLFGEPIEVIWVALDAKPLFKAGGFYYMTDIRGTELEKVCEEDICIRFNNSNLASLLLAIKYEKWDTIQTVFVEGSWGGKETWKYRTTVVQSERSDAPGLRKEIHAGPEFIRQFLEEYQWDLCTSVWWSETRQLLEKYKLKKIKQYQEKKSEQSTSEESG